MFARIIFMDDEQGREIVDALTHTDGSVMYGATVASIEAVVDYLSEWDNGEYHDITYDTGAGVMDVMAQCDDYVLTWNSGLGYVALALIIGADGLPVAIDTCRGCGQPVDMCLDHTHAPAFEDEDYSKDYDAVSDRLGALDMED